MTSPTSSATASPAAVSDGRACRWCGRELDSRNPGFYCSKKCRQASFRLRRRRGRVATEPESAEPGLFVYADPPYVGKAKLYADQPSFAGEVDQAALIVALEERRARGEVAGWALSCSRESLRQLLPLCPEGVELCTWVKPSGVPAGTYGIHTRTEHVLVVGGRKARPGVRDWMMAHAARGGGELMGRKPIAFCAWLFDLLGMVPGDRLEDVFPGTGVVGRAWTILSKTATRPADGMRARFVESYEGGAGRLVGGVAEDVLDDEVSGAGADPASPTAVSDEESATPGEDAASAPASDGARVP